MKNCVCLYTALLHHLSFVSQLFGQNILAPIDDPPKAASLSSETRQISCSRICSLLSQLPSKLNILAEKIRAHGHALLLSHIYLFQNQTALLFDKISLSLCPLSPRQEFSSYILDTIPNGILSHRQHGLCFSIPQRHYIKVLPIEGSALMRFSSPTKSRSIQSQFLVKIAAS